MERIKTYRSFAELVCNAEKTSQSVQVESEGRQGVKGRQKEKQEKFFGPGGEDNVRPALSVLVPVYNHEKYLRQCIDSIRMQKMDFRAEVLIAEDCSTDGSRRVLQEMEREPDWPPNFHILYRPHNFGMWANGEDLYRRAKGKYLIVLEGDDYWTYDHKLQEQYDFLERHPEFTGAAHPCRVVDDDGEPFLPLLRKPFFPFLWSWTYPSSSGDRRRIYTFRDWCLFRLPGQTAALMFRNFIGEDKEGRRSIRKNDEAVKNYPRDQIKAFLLAVHGPIYCFPETWSAYRYHPDSGTSFSGSQPVSWEVRKAFYQFAVRYGKSRLSRKERSGLLLRMATDRMVCSMKKALLQAVRPVP